MITSKCLRLVMAAGTIAAAASGAATARADAKLGNPGTTSLSAERLAGFGLTYFADSGSDTYYGGGDSEVSYSFSLFGSRMVENLLKVMANRRAFVDRWGPRLAFDTFVGDGVSLGGSALFSVTSMPEDNDTVWSMGVAPRIGFTSRTDSGTFIWFKAGFTTAFGVVDDDSAYAVDLNVQCDFVFPLTDSFGWTLSPTFDVPLLAETSSGGSYREDPISPWSLAINLGIAGWY